MISSVSVYPSFKVTSLMVASGKLQDPNNHFYLIRNISHVFIGLLAFAFVAKTPYSVFEKYSKHIFLSSLVLLVAVLFVGVTYNGAKGWINVPFLPFSLQPVEFAKLWMVLYFAAYLKRKKAVISDFSNGFVPYMWLLTFVIFLLALQPDFWSILLIAPVAVWMFFVAGGNIKHLWISALVAIVFATSVYVIGKTSSNSKVAYISQRVDNFLSDNKTSIQNQTINFQTKQGLIAIGSGWFFGLWFGMSVQKFGYLPEVQGDFIFSVIAEELWFLGVLILLSVFWVIGYRALNIGMRSEDLFARYCAVGIALWLLIQAFVNIGVNLNILPLTGVTLPFVSYGGSSLLSLLIWMGVLLNISKHVKNSTTKSYAAHSTFENKSFI